VRCREADKLAWQFITPRAEAGLVQRLAGTDSPTPVDGPPGEGEDRCRRAYVLAVACCYRERLGLGGMPRLQTCAGVVQGGGPDGWV